MEEFDDLEYDACDDCDEFDCEGKTSRNKELGARGEEAAAKYLEHMGFEILERNWHCFAGEADIIALDGECLVFVEVKTRTSNAKGLPEEAVTKDKRHRYERIAIEYLRENYFNDISVRFDVIGITLIEHNRAFLRHHRDAFGRGE